MKHWIYLLLLSLLWVGCESQQMEDFLRPLVKAPGATIERGVKGHEQIYSVQAILRLARLRSNGKSYAAYGLSPHHEPPIPIYQQIDISKNEMGRVSITSTRKHFDVVKAKNYYYALELKYYDLNGKLINHQFAHFDAEDPEGSTLQHHQHFFALQNYSLEGQHLLYPMTTDSLYWPEYTFATNTAGERMESSLVSPNNVYVPIATPKAPLRYDGLLAQRAVEVATTKAALAPYKAPHTGLDYRLYKSLNLSQLNDKTREIFSYRYRDTDPVESELYTSVKGLDDLGRQRVGKPTQLLQQRRDLSTQHKQDYLGFKGVLQFHKSDVAFQMRICIAHIISPKEKYVGLNKMTGVLHEHDQISPAWNSFDIDYPLGFRVIADADEAQEKFVADVRRFYPQADAARLTAMFANNADWFRHYSISTF